MATSINFPDNPTIDETYTYSGTTYIWNGTTWGLVPSGLSPNTVGIVELKPELKSRIVLATDNIDWSLGIEFTKTLTANWTVTESNLPTGTDTDCIVLYITGSFTVTPPAYWVWKGGVYDGTVNNMFVVDCLNGTGASEIVNYIIIPDA